MASVETINRIDTRFLDQNYSECGENMCAKCCIMKDHLELLISEVKSSQLIIKILLEEIKSTSIGPKNQDNLTNGAEYKSHDESHPATRTVHGRKFDAPKQRLRNTRDATTQNKGLQAHSHYHRTDITLCVMFRKETISQKVQEFQG
jgi:hypothetical protein